MGDSRAKILETAEKLFAEHGLEGVGMREVARQVGLSKSALFHHFPTKIELYTAVHERILEAVDKKLEAASEATSDALEQLRRWIDVFVDDLAEQPSHSRLLLRSLFDSVADEDATCEARIEARLFRIIGRVADWLDAGVRSGRFRPVSIPHTIQTLIGMTVYHFAAGDQGDQLFESPVFSAAEVQRRKDHIYDFLTHALVQTT